MAEEIDLEKCTFRNFGSSVTLTLTLDRVEVTRVRICGRGLPTHQIRWKSEKLFVDVRTDGRTHLSSNLLGHRRGDDLKIEIKIYWQLSSYLTLYNYDQITVATANNAKNFVCLSVVGKIDILCLKPHVIYLNRFGKYKMKEYSNIKYSVPQRPQTDALRCDSLRYCDDFTTNVLWWTINKIYYNATRAHVHSVIDAA